MAYHQKRTEKGFDSDCDYEPMVNLMERRSLNHMKDDNLYENLSNLKKNVPKKNKNSERRGENRPLTPESKPSMKLNCTDKLPKITDDKGHSYYVLDFDLMKEVEKNTNKRNQSMKDSLKLGDSRIKRNPQDVDKVKNLPNENPQKNNKEIIKQTSFKVNRPTLAVKRTESLTVRNRANTQNVVKSEYTTPKPKRIAPPPPIPLRGRQSNSDPDINKIPGHNYSQTDGKASYPTYGASKYILNDRRVTEKQDALKLHQASPKSSFSLAEMNQRIENLHKKKDVIFDVI